MSDYKMTRDAAIEQVKELEAYAGQLENILERKKAKLAKLAEAVEALEDMLELCSVSANEINPIPVKQFAADTIAELKGETDE